MFDFVPATRARELISDALKPVVADMQRARDGLMVRQISDEIRAVVQVDALKGAQFDIVYGVCCAWVPVAAGKARPGTWPKTLKQTRRHLWVDHFTRDAPKRTWISTSGGDRALVRQARAAADHVQRHAPKWWETVSAPEGVLGEARRQAENEFDIHSPRAQLVAAFTLARLGDLPAARALLTPDDEADDVQSLLKMVRMPPAPG